MDDTNSTPQPKPVELTTRANLLKRFYNFHLNNAISFRINHDLFASLPPKEIVNEVPVRLPDGQQVIRKISAEQGVAQFAQKLKQEVALLSTIQTLLEAEGVKVAGETLATKIAI